MKTLLSISLIAVLLFCGSCFEKARDTTVYGKVTDSLGHPLAGIPLNVSYFKGFISGRSITLAQGKTDSAGRYSMHYIPDRSVRDAEVTVDFYLLFPNNKYRTFLVDDPYIHTATVTERNLILLYN